MSAPTRYELACHPLLLAVAGGLNFPPVVFGILGYLSWCGYYSSWLVGNGCLCALHLVAAFYSVYKIRKLSQPPPIIENDEEEPEVEAPPSSESEVEKDESLETDSNDDEASAGSTNPQNEIVLDNHQRTRGCFSRLIRLRTISSDRIRHLLCYDGIYTTYTILFFVWIFWLSEGIERTNSTEYAEESEFFGCEAFHYRYVKISLVCGFSYFSFVTFAALGSLCWR